MQKKLLPALAATVIGASLLVGAAFAGSASSAGPAKAGGSEAKRGGTLRINLSTTDFEYLDPALSYEAPGWQVLYMTNLMLLNYPDKPAPEGSRLVPDAATGFPRVSRDGRTYTFTIKSGLRFSDGSAVTAAAFKRAFERAANQQQGSPAIAFMHDVVGADERNEGKAGAVTGVARERPGPDDPAEAGEPDLPGRDRDAVLRGREAEHGDRQPRHQRLSVRRPVSDRQPHRRQPGRAGAEHLLQGQPACEPGSDRDLDEHGREPEPAPGACRPDRLRPVRPAADGARRPLAPVRRQEGRRRPLLRQHRHQHVYLALNASRPALGKVSLRKAINHAIDRPALLRVAGKYAGKRTDQILPPNMQGFRDANLYPIKGANPARGRALANGAKDEITLLYTTSPTSVARAQILKYNLEQIGLSVTLKPQPFAVALRTAGTRGSDFDAFLIAWFADYPDPFDFINVLLDGQNIQAANNSNYSYLSSPKYNKLMTDASKLSGGARYDAYGKLDVDMMRNAAPWAPLSNGNVREFISSRVTNYLFHPVYGGAIMNALALR